MNLTSEMKEIFNQQNLYSLATASKDGIPNVAPMGVVKLLDDQTILFSDQFMSKTLKNLKENPYAAVSFWKGGTGYQVKGPVEIHQSGEVFDNNVAWVKEIKPNLTPKSAVVLHIEEIYYISPGKNAGKRIE